MPVPTPTRNAHLSKFKPMTLVWIYRYAKAGLSEAAIAEAIKVGIKTWAKWKRLHAEIAETIQLARTDTKDGGTWHSYVYERLSEELKEVWDKINEWDELPNGIVKIETLLATHGRQVRQQLFLHALVHYNFSFSRALSKVNIDKKTLDYWIQNDPGFADLVEEIQWHKGNFFEESLATLIKGHDVAATIFANRTFNKERGYGIKNEVNIKHSGSIEHNLLDLSELELTQEVKLAILDAIRKRDATMKAQRNKAIMPPIERAREELIETIANPIL